MAELVDAPVSKTGGGDPVSVRFRPSAPYPLTPLLTTAKHLRLPNRAILAPKMSPVKLCEIPQAYNIGLPRNQSNQLRSWDEATWDRTVKSNVSVYDAKGILYLRDEICVSSGPSCVAKSLRLM